ncbi:MAG: vanadium-dependent haloperoxidase [Ferruginibacter sp.]|nr:vanadium-dependent haloperoxidase [Ferruginibacter sp.]
MQPRIFRGNHGLSLVALCMVLSLLVSCVKDHPLPPTASHERGDVVFDWYKMMIRIQLYTTPAPVVLLNNRAFAYVGIGLYESVQPGIKGALSLSSKLYQMPAMPEPGYHGQYDWEASANAALASLFRQFSVNLTDANKASMDSLEKAWNKRIKSHTREEVLARSRAFGQSIATAVYNWSTSDNFNLSAAGYEIQEFPGAWERTPPAMALPVGPFLKNSRPLLQSSLSVNAPPLPFPYSPEPSSKFYKAAEEVYNIALGLTTEQKYIASRWADVGGPGVGFAGGGHLLFIATEILEKKNTRLGEAAEMYAKMGIALKEAIYRVWKGKFDFLLLRPITYINDHIDGEWTSFLATPPYPDYPSGLVALYSAAMQILVRQYGDMAVTDNAYVWRGDGPRHFPSITKLVEEAGDSRIYAGIHYRFTQEITIQFAKELGNTVYDINLTGKRNP